MIDYKKVIRSPEARARILRTLGFIPDRQMVCLQYFVKTGRWPNLKNPQRFTEKLQRYKLNYRDERMVRCVDKADVREYVASKGLSDILIPCYGVYDSIDSIDWLGLPDSFVMKDTLGGGGRSVEIVSDKHTRSLAQLVKRAEEWLARDSSTRDAGCEWPYNSGKSHRVIFEQMLESDAESGGLIDYKFFCFDGEPQFMYVVADRVVGSKAELGVYNMSFEQLPVTRDDEEPLRRDVPTPVTFERMKYIARTLSSDFPEARVDLYEVGGRVRFGEITFFDGSGYMTFTPDEFDFEIGRLFALPERKKPTSLQIGKTRVPWRRNHE